VYLFTFVGVVNAWNNLPPALGLLMDLLSTHLKTDQTNIGPIKIQLVCWNFSS